LSFCRPRRLRAQDAGDRGGSVAYGLQLGVQAVRNLRGVSRRHAVRIARAGCERTPALADSQGAAQGGTRQPRACGWCRSSS
jgi:hypothetical protein